MDDVVHDRGLWIVVAAVVGISGFAHLFTEVLREPCGAGGGRCTMLLSLGGSNGENMAIPPAHSHGVSLKSTVCIKTWSNQVQMSC
ncbi:MAG: hypothetical protein CVU65_00840 [Deltaproteobacteria bacterium HGW-Deltaproteobacteria-22]|nr:MAG: hypothetical protein CVU65_00840 [Deltaproteobacteria bacterium HGW-Deltaproteobacteria-22]